VRLTDASIHTGDHHDPPLGLAQQGQTQLGEVHHAEHIGVEHAMHVLHVVVLGHHASRDASIVDQCNEGKVAARHVLFNDCNGLHIGLVLGDIEDHRNQVGVMHRQNALPVFVFANSAVHFVAFGTESFCRMSADPCNNNNSTIINIFTC
jgi:hypothetical protein